MSPLLLVALLPSAPAPQPRPVDVTPGEWVLTLSPTATKYNFGGTWTYTLHPDGTCSWRTQYSVKMKAGTWSWDSRKRLLYLTDVDEETTSLLLLRFKGLNSGTWERESNVGEFTLRREVSR